MTPAALRDIDRIERPVACCREPANLSCTEVAKDIFVERCSACGRRHYVGEADPVQVGLVGSAIG